MRLARPRPPPPPRSQAWDWESGSLGVAVADDDKVIAAWQRACGKPVTERFTTRPQAKHACMLTLPMTEAAVAPLPLQLKRPAFTFPAWRPIEIYTPAAVASGS